MTTPAPHRASLHDLRRVGAAEARFELRGAGGRIRVEWGRKPRVLVGDRALYAMGWPCSTCEGYLALAGWPPEIAARVDGDLRERARRAPRGMDLGWIAGWAPLLGELADGDYLAGWLDLPVVEVREESPERSPWVGRRAARAAHHPSRYPGGPEEHDWPGALHYAGPGYTWGQGELAFEAVMPSQPMEWQDSVAVEGYAAQIAAGGRPAVIAMGWIDERYVDAWFLERVFQLVVLDGHHKLAAYARSGTPARILAICRIADGFGGDDGYKRQMLSETFARYGVPDRDHTPEPEEDWWSIS